MSVCATGKIGRWSALGSLLIAVGLVLTSSTAGAQSTSGAWEPAPSAAASSLSSSPSDATIEVAEPRTQRVPRRGLLTAGIAILGVAYVGAAAWGSYFLADLQLGVPSCNDQYAGWHFLPIAGPLIGTLTGAQCIPDTIHFEEVLMPIIFTVGQLVGLALLVGGLVGHVVEVPAIDIAASSDGAIVRVGGSF